MSEFSIGPNLGLPLPSSTPGLSSGREVARPDAANGGASSEAAGGSSKSFLDTLKDAIGGVNEMQKSADASARKFAAGQGSSLHEVMITMEKAELSLRTLTAVRNKMVEAYQEIMKMPV